MSKQQETEARLRALMLASLAGDAAAYRQLLTDLSARLRAYYARRLYGALAANDEDLVQETLMAIHARRLTYDPAQPFTAWVFALARYKLIDHFRRHRIRASVPLNEDLALFSHDEEPQITARLDVEVALGTLPERPRELIRRVRIEGASIADAAAGAGMTETAAKVSIHRGLKALTARFGGRGNDR